MTLVIVKRIISSTGKVPTQIDMHMYIGNMHMYIDLQDHEIGDCEKDHFFDWQGADIDAQQVSAIYAPDVHFCM